MGRKARKSYETSFFHVLVQGIEKKYIFKNNHYMEKYIKLMNKYDVCAYVCVFIKIVNTQRINS